MGRLVARRRALVSAIAVVLLLSACGSAHSHASSPPSSRRPPASSTATSSAPSGGAHRVVKPATPVCHLPLTHDTYDGFHIAVPAGWDLSALQGRVEVKKDASETEAVVVVPAVQTNGLSADSFFTSTLKSIQQQVQSGGGTFTVTSPRSASGSPEASITATASGQGLEGKAGLMTLRLPTQLSNTELAFFLYWAPQGALASDDSMLRSVAQCFGPEKGTLFSVAKDQVFTYELPPGWRVGDETSDVLDLHHGSDADVSYALVAPLPPQAASSTQGFIDYVLGQDNVTGVTAIARNASSDQSTEYEEFTGSLNGQAVHGVMSGQLTAGGTGSGVIRLALANQGEWNSITGALVQMAGFIQHGFTQDASQLQQLSQQWQNFSGQVANFDDTLNNQQLVQDPTTDKLYEAPYSAYGSGNQGPGYYLDNGVPGGQLLNEVERK